MVNKKMTRKTKTIRIKTRKHKYNGGATSNANLPPTLKDNLTKFANIFVQVLNNVGMYTLDKVEDGVSNASKSFGVDPNKSFKEEFVKMGQKAEQMNNALDSPEGKRALLNLTNLFNRITENVLVPSSEKLTEELIENIQPILVRGQNAVFALLSASPFGAVIDIPRFFSESLGVVEKSVSLADDVLDVGQDSVDQIKAEKGNFDNVVSEFNSLIDQTNTQISSGLDSVQSRVNQYGTNATNATNALADVNQYGTNALADVNQYGTNALANATQYGTNATNALANVNQYGTNAKNALSDAIDATDVIQYGTNMNNSLKNYQNEAKMVGGRINKSTSEFFTSGGRHKNKPQKRKWSTRKRKYFN